MACLVFCLFSAVNDIFGNYSLTLFLYLSLAIHPSIAPCVITFVAYNFSLSVVSVSRL